MGIPAGLGQTLATNISKWGRDTTQMLPPPARRQQEVLGTFQQQRSKVLRSVEVVNEREGLRGHKYHVPLEDLDLNS